MYEHPIATWKERLKPEYHGVKDLAMEAMQSEIGGLRAALVQCVQHSVKQANELQDENNGLQAKLAERSAEYLAAHTTHDKGYQAGREDSKGNEEDLMLVLSESLYALEYGVDMTKPEGMSGCNCPSCTVIPKIRKLLGENQ